MTLAKQTKLFEIGSPVSLTGLELCRAKDDLEFLIFLLLPPSPVLGVQVYATEPNLFQAGSKPRSLFILGKKELILELHA